MHQPDILPSSLWRKLLPPCATVYETRSFTHSPFLHPEEIPAIRNAMPKRAEEFAAGRACARRALAELGCAPTALPRGANRSPVWPQAITGSITHTDGHCAAALAWRHEIMSIGIDAEIIGHVTNDMLHLICTSVERTQLAAMDSEQRAETATILFSAKEAFFKCQSNAGGNLPDFQDIELLLQSSEFSVTPRRAFIPAHQATLKGRYMVSKGMVFTAITFPAS